MQRKVPPRIKVYEALGSLGDKRVEIVSPTEAKAFSSSGNKFYTVKYDSDQHAVMMNDKGAYRNGYLGYTGIAFLMLVGDLPYNESFSDALKGIARKDINVQFKNKFDLTQRYVDDILVGKGIDLNEFSAFIDSVLDIIKEQPFDYLGKKILPPAGY